MVINLSSVWCEALWCGVSHQTRSLIHRDVLNSEASPPSASHIISPAIEWETSVWKKSRRKKKNNRRPHQGEKQLFPLWILIRWIDRRTPLTNYPPLGEGKSCLLESENRLVLVLGVCIFQPVVVNTSLHHCKLNHLKSKASLICLAKFCLARVVIGSVGRAVWGRKSKGAGFFWRLGSRGVHPCPWPLTNTASLRRVKLNYIQQLSTWARPWRR